jgi:hypothetical protein
LARDLLDENLIPKFSAGIRLGICGRLTAGDPITGCHLQVGADLFV